MTDRASAEGLREALISVGWFPDLDPEDYDRLARQLASALRSSESDSGIDVDRLTEAIHEARFTSKRPHTDREFAEAILARLSTPRTETSES